MFCRCICVCRRWGVCSLLEVDLEEVFGVAGAGGDSELLYGEVSGSAEQVEADGIVVGVYGLLDFMAELFVLSGAEFAFEDGVLDVLEVFAADLEYLRHSLDVDVVDHEDVHLFTSGSRMECTTRRR